MEAKLVWELPRDGAWQFEPKWDRFRCLACAGHGAPDGVIAKPLDPPYVPGERTMLKVKCLRTADCVSAISLCKLQPRHRLALAGFI
jgi:ATP-dependent DNA ligase